PAFDTLRGEHDAAVWTNRRYRLPEVVRLLEAAGFTIRRRFYRNSILFPVAALRRLASRQIPKGGEARSDAGPVNRAMDSLCSGVLRFEEALHRAGAWFPFGLSVLCVAQRSASPVPRLSSRAASASG